MPTLNINQTSNPAPLGYLIPTPGTPLGLGSNFTNPIGQVYQSMSLQSHPSNTGLIYLLNSKAAADTVAGTNVVAVLSAGQSLPFSGIALGGINPSAFWVDADSAGQIAIPVVFGA